MLYGVSTTNDASGVTSWSESLPTGLNAGTYYVFYYIEGTDYFEDTDPALVGTVTIEKAKTAIPVPRVNLEYDGQVQEGVEPNALYTIEGNDETRAGKYTATVSLKDKVNYKWADAASTQSAEVASLAAAGDSEDLQIDWEIAQRPITFTVNNATKQQDSADPAYSVSITNVVEGETLQAGVDYSFSRVQGEDPGDYAVTVLANETETMANYSPTVNDGTLTITAVNKTDDSTSDTSATTTTADDTNSKGGILNTVSNALAKTGDKVIIGICCVAALLVASACALIIGRRKKEEDGEETC